MQVSHRPLDMARCKAAPTLALARGGHATEASREMHLRMRVASSLAVCTLCTQITIRR